jgi:predicted RNA-binding protein with PUA-like domain
MEMMNHWLVKTEPSTYSFADLEGEKQTRWTGVANPLAQKHLRAMAKGDPVLVYHTGAEKQIVGIADVQAPGEEPELRFREWLKRPVTLAAIKARKDFADFALVRIGRLSVLPVSAAQWKSLCAMAG